MKRQLCSLLVAGLMLASSLTAFAADVTVPKDVTGTTYEQAVKTLMEKGVVSGYADGTYRPAESITRGEACAMIVKYLAPTEEAMAQVKESAFKDMKDSWAVSYVNYAVDKDIVKGYSDNTFRPDAFVNYDEMAAMLVNALGANKDLTGTWPANYVNKAKSLGIFANVNVSNTGEKGCNRGDVALMVSDADKYKADAAAATAAKDLLVAADKKVQELKSMSFSMNMDMNMTAAGQTIATKTTGTVDAIMDPISMKMVMDMDMGALGSQKMETYMVNESGTLMVYTLAADKWTKQAGGNADAMEQLSGKDNMDLYLSAYDTVRMEGKDTINGKTATKLYCTMAEDYMQKALGVAGMEDQLKGAGVNDAALKDMFKDIKGFAYYIWIDDATGMAVKYDMDMTDMMKQVMKNVADMTTKEDPTAAEALKQISFSKVQMNMTITGTDNVKEIVLPEAAKGATLVTAPAVTK